MSSCVGLLFTVLGSWGMLLGVDHLLRQKTPNSSTGSLVQQRVLRQPSAPGVVPATKSVALFFRDRPKKSGNVSLEVGVELQVKIDRDGRVVGQNCKPSISTGSYVDSFIIPLLRVPTSFVRVRQETNWKGKAKEPVLEETHRKIPIDPNGFKTEVIEQNGSVMTLIGYKGELLETKCLEADVRFDLQAQTETIVELTVGAEQTPIFTHRTVTSNSVMCKIRTRHSLDSDWCYADIVTARRAGPEWHNPSRDGDTMKGDVDWSWGGEWEVKWEKQVQPKR